MKRLIGFVGKHISKIMFVFMHLSLLSVFFVPLTGTSIVLCVGFYYLRMFGITAGHHRGLSHLSYKSKRWLRFMLAWLGCSAMQRGPIWWVANHRNHHRFSDTKKDPHSPRILGFWYAHVGWIFYEKVDENDFSGAKDLLKCPELCWLEKFHWVPGLSLLLIAFLIDGLSGVVWGFVVSTILLYHGTFFVNSVCHLFGSQRFNTNDDSRNNFWVAIIFTLGEGWHNNHHHRPARAKQGLVWWELDFSYYLLWLMSLTGLVWELHKPHHKILKK